MLNLLIKTEDECKRRESMHEMMQKEVPQFAKNLEVIPKYGFIPNPTMRKERDLRSNLNSIIKLRFII